MKTAEREAKQRTTPKPSLKGFKINGKKMSNPHVTGKPGSKSPKDWT